MCVCESFRQKEKKRKTTAALQSAVFDTLCGLCEPGIVEVKRKKEGERENERRSDVNIG